MPETDKLVSGFKANLAAKVVEVGVNGLLVLLLTNVFLTTEEYGLLYLAISICSVAIFFSRMGFAKSAARYVTEFRETDPSKIPFIVRRALTFNVIAIAVVAGTVLAFRGPIAAQFGEPDLVWLLTIGFLFIVARTLHSFGYFLCQGFNRVSWSALLLIVANLGILASVLSLLALGFGVAGALFGYVVGYALSATLGLTVLYRWVSGADWNATGETAATGSTDGEGASSAGSDDADETENLTRRIFEYSLPLTVTGAASILYKRVDIVLVGAILSPVAVGYYTLAKQLTEFVTAPASSLGFALAPAYGESKSSDNLERAAEIYHTTFEYNLLFYVPAAAGIALVADPAVRYVFGDGYLGAIPIVQVLAAFVVLQSINKITDDALDFLGRARHRALSKGGTAALNFVLNLVLLPTIGVVGAALSTVISYAIMVGINIYLIHSELSLPLRSLFRTALTVCSIAGGMSLIVVLGLPYVSSVASLLAIVLLGVVSWLALAVTSGLLDLRRAVAQLS
ncbi:flippase [Halopiger xanaduensis]|uniref:Polysaccharide biosynthesis protein n=1 Tax=Halopiger xanaduensis (strain DSM 18323 / JCM 14033 / SH-6) TaxID=797210 RepID=F8D5C6_HALXS|nr:flippase [Halopiger xanaduensis]AEH37625.1 polysaccharide biosynthesis protein [Halopiger xanaduensis SH-6]